MSIPIRHLIIFIAYITTGWMLYELFLKNRENCKWIQVILWPISTSPFIYFPWKYDIKWIAKLRIF